jgi:hypothetical protein
VAKLSDRPALANHRPSDIEVPDPASDQRAMVPVAFIPLTVQFRAAVASEPTGVVLAVPAQFWALSKASMFSSRMRVCPM